MRSREMYGRYRRLVEELSTKKSTDLDWFEELQAVVLRCLAKGPADRFADAESLEIALAGCHTNGQWSETLAADWWRSPGGCDWGSSL